MLLQPGDLTIHLQTRYQRPFTSDRRKAVIKNGKMRHKTTEMTKNM